MKLQVLSELLIHAKLIGDGETEITGIEMDSRKVKQGDLFVCIRGERFDGHQYAKEAIGKGAVALLTMTPLDVKIPQIVYPNTRYAMSVFASHYYQYPSSDLKLIGITGTNGKTTTANLLEHMLQSHHKTGLMGTIEMKIDGRKYEVSNTTQEATVLQRSFSPNGR